MSSFLEILETETPKNEKLGKIVTEKLAILQYIYSCKGFGRLFCLHWSDVVVIFFAILTAGVC